MRQCRRTCGRGHRAEPLTSRSPTSLPSLSCTVGRRQARCRTGLQQCHRMRLRRRNARYRARACRVSRRGLTRAADDTFVNGCFGVVEDIEQSGARARSHAKSVRLAVAVILPQPPLARLNDSRRSILDPQLVYRRPDTRHRPRRRQRQQIPKLQAPQQKPGLSARLRRPRRRLHFSVQPDQRFVRG
jgi:hypothetical protein